MYDFTTLRPRIGMGSEKWDQVKQTAGETIVPFTVADMEFCTAPEIVQAVREIADFGMWGYTYDDDSFRRAVAEWMQSRHSWEIDTNWIVTTPGVVPALYTAVRAFTSPGDGIIIQPPVYPPFHDAIRGNRRKILENPLICQDGNYKMDFDGLAKLAPSARMMILCSPHNPVGRVWSIEELELTADICQKNNIILLSDEIHNDIIMPGHHHTVFGCLANRLRKNCVIATSASKTFSLAGLSASSIIIEEEGLRRKFKARRNIDGTYFNSTFGWVATKAAYMAGAPWLEQMLDVIAENNAKLNESIQRHIPAIKTYPLEGTYLAWIDCRTLGMDNTRLIDVLQNKARFYINSGALFGTGGEGFIRINLACPTEILLQALQRLFSVLK